MSGSSLLWMVLLLLANGFFVAAEFAYITARRNILETTGSRSSMIAAGLNRDLSVSLAGAQLGITMASLLLGAVAEPAIAAIFESALGTFFEISEATIHAISLALALVIVVFLHMVIGEMAPKNIAIASPESTATALALPFRAFIVVFRPLIWLLNGIANFILGVFGVKPADALEMGHSAQDLSMIISAGRKEGVIEDFAHDLLSGAIVFGDLDVEQAMIPRPDIVSADVASTAGEIVGVMQRSGHSRLPIHGGDLDDLLGYVHVKDLIGLDEGQRRQPIDRDVIRAAAVLPETSGLPRTLEEMRQRRTHLALVVDEHGTISGLITMEDIAEELVGDIRDEHDAETSPVRRIGANWYEAPGSLRIDAMSGFGFDLPSGDYETLGGLVVDRLGRLARKGDVVSDGDWEIEVTKVERRRVRQVVVRKLESG